MKNIQSSIERGHVGVKLLKKGVSKEEYQK